MKRTLAGVIAAAVLVSGAGIGMAQTSTAPKSPDTTTKSTTDPAKPSMSSRMDKAAGKHSVQGEVTRVDAKDGWVHVKTSEGTMIVHVPPSDLGSVKKGDMVALDLSIMGNGPAPKK
jgi:polyisoprenoid-binding protein YceI